METNRVNQLVDQTTRMLGYQVNQNFPNELDPRLFNVILNNCGDPYDDMRLPNTKDIERKVLDYFYSLLGHGGSDRYWGYLGTGGTEGNIWGLNNGRNQLCNPIVLYSRDAHYSIEKALDLLDMEGHAIDVDKMTGSMDSTILSYALNDYRNRDVIVMATHGTTFPGGYDDLLMINSQLEDHNKKTYLHLDGAFGVPYVAHGGFNFNEGIPYLDLCDSLSFSVHKFYGHFTPSSVILCNKDSMGESERVDYISSRDSTICGSRDGLAPLYLWDRISKPGFSDMMARIAKMMCNNSFLFAQKLEELGYNSRRYADSNCVVFDEPSDYIIRKYSLSVNGRGEAHLWVMPHITKEVYTEFMRDIYHEDKNHVNQTTQIKEKGSNPRGLSKVSI